MSRTPDLTCFICGTVWVVPSLARHCEDKCQDYVEWDEEDDDQG